MQKIDTTPKDAASKKNKRKSKRTNGVNGATTNGNEDEPTPSEVPSYAEAVKEDPDVAAKRLADGATGTSGVKPNGKEGSDKEISKPTPAGDLTFAQAVKDGPTDANETSRSNDHAKQQPSEEKNSDQSTPAFSQASTTVDYPEIRSDDGDEEEEQRRRDKEKAAVVAGARWAPLGVPVKRRLQTAAVLMHCVGIGLSLSIFFALCAVPIFWPISMSNRLRFPPTRCAIVVPGFLTCDLSYYLPLYDNICNRCHGWQAQEAQRVGSQAAHLDLFRRVLPCKASQNARPATDKKVHLWLSPAWHHLPWCLGRVCNGRAWILRKVSRYYQQSPHS